MKHDESFSLQDAMNELAAIENIFQKNDLDLTIALEKHKEAQLLAKKIMKYLHEIETKLETIEIAELSA